MKKIVAIVAVPLLSLLIFSSYIYIKNYRKKAGANRLYAEGLKFIMDKNNQFSARAEINFYDSLIKQQMPQEQLFVIFANRVFSLLKRGKEKEAAEILENIYREKGGTDDALSKQIEQNLALSYLRLRERNNCVHNHSAETCIFPIRGSGIYTDPEFRHWSDEGRPESCPAEEIEIGKANDIDELGIKWPATGTIQKFNNVTTDQFIKIREGVNQIEKMNLKALVFKEGKGDLKMMDMPDMK